MILVIPVGRRTSTTATGTPGVDMTGRDLVREALLEIGVLNTTEAVTGEDADYGLSKLNRLLDRWNAKGSASFATAFTAFTLTPSLSPHTIGPTGTFVVVERPIEIDGANLVVNDIRTPITVRTKQWYQGLSTPELTSTIPTDVYYEPAVPNGKLWFFPVGLTAYQVELWQRGLLARMTLSALLVAPAGYRDAIVLSLAEQICTGPFRVPMPQGLPENARDARATIFANNDEIATLDTRDAGMPGACGGSWDYRTGTVR